MTIFEIFFYVLIVVLVYTALATETSRIVMEGLRGEYSIAELCRREGIHQWIPNKVVHV